MHVNVYSQRQICKTKHLFKLKCSKSFIHLSPKWFPAWVCFIFANPEPRVPREWLMKQGEQDLQGFSNSHFKQNNLRVHHWFSELILQCWIQWIVIQIMQKKTCNNISYPCQSYWHNSIKDLCMKFEGYNEMMLQHFILSLPLTLLTV